MPTLGGWKSHTCGITEPTLSKCSGFLPQKIGTVQSISCVWLFVNPWTAACQTSLSFTSSQSLLKFISNESVILSNHCILCGLLPLPSTLPSIIFFFSPMSWFFPLDGQSIGTLASVLPVNIQGWFPLGLTYFIYFQSKGISRVFSRMTVQNHQFFSSQPSLWSNTHIHTWLLEKA